MSKAIELHYNAFESLELQIVRQGCQCKNIDIYEKAKDDILYLYVQGFLSESEKDRAFNRLHKEIIKELVIKDE